MNVEQSFTLVIPAAGSGSRMGLGTNKLFHPLEGKPILLHTLEAFLGNPALEEIVLAVRAGEESQVMRILEGLSSAVPIRCVAGGETRQDSVHAGIRASQGSTYLWVHDGARPFVSAELQTRLLEAARYGSVVAAVPVKDTIKRVSSEGRVCETLNREELWGIQTPQVFRRELLLEAYGHAERSGYSGTDDASLVEWAGHPVRVVMGDYRNIKLTTPEDLLFGEAVLASWKG